MNAYAHASCQDIQRCQICDNTFAELFCVYCKTKLCKRCTGGYLAENPEKHKIVRILDRYTTLVLPICDIHSPQRCRNYCQQCDLAVCSFCISSKSHEQHKFLKIEDIFNSKKEVLKKDSDELEQKILPSYEAIVKEVRLNREILEEKFGTVFKDIEKQRELWHQEIDNIIKALKQDVSGMRKMQRKIQSDHLGRMKKHLLIVKESIQKSKDLLDTLEISESLSYESMNSTLMRFPPKLEISVPRFIPKAIENELNSEKIGVITGFCISNEEGGYQCKSRSGCLSRGHEEENEENMPKEVMNKPQTMTTVETKIRGPKNVACTRNKKLWVSSVERSILLFKCDESVNTTCQGFESIDLSVLSKGFQADKKLMSIAMTITDDLVYGKILSNKIGVLKENEVKELIDLNNWSLLSLCMTANNGLLVCMTDAKGYACRIVRFEESEERQIIQYNSEGKRLFTPGTGRKFIKENRNGDVCVADYDGRAVIVTDKKGTFKFQYTKDFLCPIGIATDSQAHLIVPYMHHRSLVHIVDKNGYFLHFLSIFQCYTEEIGLDVDNEDNLYIVEMNGALKIVRYMKYLHE